MDERSGIDSMVRWLRIRERSGLPAPTSYAELVDAIGHSALLRRLLSGRTPLRVPPPRSYGQPWYGLVENGGADGCDLRTLKDRPGATPRVTVNEWAWNLVEERSDGRLVLRYSPEASLYVAERESGEPERWRLVRHDLWAERSGRAAVAQAPR